MHKHPTDLHNLFSSYFSVLLSAMYYSQLLTISPFLEIKNTDNEKHHRKKRITLSAIIFIHLKTCTLLLLIIPFQIFHSRRIVCKNYTDNGTDFYFRTVSASGNTFFSAHFRISHRFSQNTVFTPLTRHPSQLICSGKIGALFKSAHCFAVSSRRS